jgi:MraZ protein
MNILQGEFECKVDERGRFKLPLKLIHDLGDQRTNHFVINRGFEKCLILYPKKVWDEQIKKINQLNIYVKKERDVLRYFYRGATEVTNDTADRLNIPGALLEYAGIDKDIVVVAFQHIIEIWSKAEYDKTVAHEPEDFASVVEGLFARAPLSMFGNE